MGISVVGKGHIARTEKVLPQINKGKIVTLPSLPRKWSKDKSQQFTEEETHKINRNVKERSISLRERGKLKQEHVTIALLS